MEMAPPRLHLLFPLMYRFQIFAISAVQVNLQNYRGKHLLLFSTKGWILTKLIGQYNAAWS